MLSKRLFISALRLGPHRHECAQGLKPVTHRGNRHHRRYVSSAATTTTTTSTGGAASAAAHGSSDTKTGTVVRKSPKHMDELTGPGLMTTLYWLFVKGYMTNPQEMQILHRKIYGPLWKAKYGPLVVVNVADADLIEQVLRQEGKYPVRMQMPHWRKHRADNDLANGPLTENGAPWQRIRSVLNPRLLKPKHVSNYADMINEVVTDFLHRLEVQRETNGHGVMVHDLTEELYKFAFEGICSVLFETRLGCFNKEVPRETQNFIISVGEAFRLSQVVLLFPSFTWPYVPPYKDFVAHWDNLFNFAGKLIQNKIDEINSKASKDLELEGAYLTHLLMSDQMTVREIVGSITEILMGGVDTTSNTVSWCLYHLAKQVDIQEQLYQEITSVCPGDKMVTSDDIAHMPLLKAVIRETLRLYPVVPGNGRVNAEKEIVMGGYIFPKDTLFHLCHYAVSKNDDIFPDPDVFLPERWLRETNTVHHPFASVPFGFGVRACIGRRVGELEMYLLLSRLLKRFEVRPDPSGVTVKPICRTLLCPAQPINLQFLDRGVQQERWRATAGGVSL